MEKRRKLNKVKVGIVLFIIVIAFSITVFGRYIYNSLRDVYLTAQQFYFESDILDVDTPVYSYNNWGGIDVYEVEFDLYSYNNKLEKLDYNLEYTLTCESLSTDKISCSIRTTDGGTTANGTIYTSSDNTAREKILVTPIDDIALGETVYLLVTARTEDPYVKEISCKFAITASTQGLNSYVIEDVANRDYAVLKLVNGNVTATQVTIEIDPDKLRLDLNDEIYQDNEGIQLDGSYVKKITFNMEAESSKNIKLYKVDKTQNYTYPGANLENVITVTI